MDRSLTTSCFLYSDMVNVGNSSQAETGVYFEVFSWITFDPVDTFPADVDV